MRCTRSSKGAAMRTRIALLHRRAGGGRPAAITAPLSQPAALVGGIDERLVLSAVSRSNRLALSAQQRMTWLFSGAILSARLLIISVVDHRHPELGFEDAGDTIRTAPGVRQPDCCMHPARRISGVVFQAHVPAPKNDLRQFCGSPGHRSNHCRFETGSKGRFYCR